MSFHLSSDCKSKLWTFLKKHIYIGLWSFWYHFLSLCSSFSTLLTLPSWRSWDTKDPYLSGPLNLLFSLPGFFPKYLRSLSTHFYRILILASPSKWVLIYQCTWNLLSSTLSCFTCLFLFCENFNISFPNNMPFPTPHSFKCMSHEGESFLCFVNCYIPSAW